MATKTRTKAEPEEEVLTLPDVAEAVGVRIDRLRLLVRRRPELAALFTVAGATRILRPGCLDRLRELLVELEAK